MTAGRTNSDPMSKDWCTPHKYVEAVKEVFGGFIELDPCSNAHSIVGAEVAWALPDEDGLKREWNFRSIYVNPPYGSDRERGTRISDWLSKCADAHKRLGSEIIALVPVAGNTRHWKDSVWPVAAAICFLFDTRLRFLENGRDTGKGAPMACACIYWGDSQRIFADTFAKFGAVVDLSNVRIPASYTAQYQIAANKLSSDRMAAGSTGTNLLPSVSGPISKSRNREIIDKLAQFDLLVDID